MSKDTIYRECAVGAVDEWLKQNNFPAFGEGILNLVPSADRLPLKDVFEWTCKYADKYKVDIDIHIDSDGEVSASVCPTYRDKSNTQQEERSKQ